MMWQFCFLITNVAFVMSLKKCYLIVPLDTQTMKLTEVNGETNSAQFLNFKD